LELMAEEEVEPALEAARDARTAGRLPEALASYRHVADAALWTGNHATRAHALRHVSDLARELGDPASALEAAEEAVEIYRANGSAPLDLANALRVAALACEEVSPGEAVRIWREARSLYLETRVGTGVAECEARLAGLDRPGSPR
jgi:tetratricopeptide (TPR) repeat protein